MSVLQSTLAEARQLRALGSHHGLEPSTSRPLETALIPPFPATLPPDLSPELQSLGLAPSILEKLQRLQDQHLGSFRRSVEADYYQTAHSLLAIQQPQDLSDQLHGNVNLLLQACLSKFRQFSCRLKDIIIRDVSARLARQRGCQPDRPSQLGKSFSKKSVIVLRQIYDQNSYPNPAELREIASHVRMDYKQCRVWFQNRRNRKSRAKAHAIVNKTQSSSSSLSKSKKASLKGKGRPPKKALSRAGSGSSSYGVGEGGGDGDEMMIGKIEDEMMGGGGALDGYSFRYDVDGLEEQQQQRSSSSAVPFLPSLSSYDHTSPLESTALTWQHPQQQWNGHHHRHQDNVSPTDFPPSSCSTLTDSPPFSADTHYFPTHSHCQQDPSSSHFSQQDYLEPPRARVPSNTSLSSHSTSADSDLSALWSITSTDHTPAYSLFSAAPEIAAGALSFKSPPSSDEANYFLPDIQPDAFVYTSPTPTTAAFMEFLSFSSPINENDPPTLSSLSVDALPHPADISSSSTSSPSLDSSSSDPTTWAQAVCDPASTAAALDPSSLISDFDLDALISSTGAGAQTGGAEYLKLDESFLPEMEKLFASYEAEGGGYDFAIPEPATGW